MHAPVADENTRRALSCASRVFVVLSSRRARALVARQQLPAATFLSLVVWLRRRARLGGEGQRWAPAATCGLFLSAVVAGLRYARSKEGDNKNRRPAAARFVPPFAVAHLAVSSFAYLF
jgi:hypothetical protein